eukprot:2306643-Prorocentrum_lima.AAC.1
MKQHCRNVSLPLWVQRSQGYSKGLLQHPTSQAFKEVKRGLKNQNLTAERFETLWPKSWAEPGWQLQHVTSSGVREVVVSGELEDSKYVLSAPKKLRTIPGLNTEPILRGLFDGCEKWLKTWPYEMDACVEIGTIRIRDIPKGKQRTAAPAAPAAPAASKQHDPNAMQT